jgi:hypothetical protein
MAFPKTFAIRYIYRSPVAPPPYHYEIALRIDANQFDAIYHFRPGYPQQPGPLWKARFPMTGPERERLYRKLVAIGFERPWKGGRVPPAGAPVYELVITGAHRPVRIPLNPLSKQDQARQLALCKAVEASIPRSLKATFEDRYNRLKLGSNPAGIQ